MPPIFEKLNNIISYITAHQKKLSRNPDADLKAWTAKRRCLRIWLSKKDLESYPDDEDYIMKNRVNAEAIPRLQTKIPELLDECLKRLTDAVEGRITLSDRFWTRIGRRILGKDLCCLHDNVREHVRFLFLCTSESMVDFDFWWKVENWGEWDGMAPSRFEGARRGACWGWR